MRRTVAGARLEIDHFHDEIEFNLIVRGSGGYALGNRVYDLKPGTLIWLLGGRRHQLKRSPHLEMWVVHARSELVDEEIAALAQEPLKQLPNRELIDLDRLLSQVAQDSDEPSVYNAGIVYVMKRAWRASRHSPAPLARPLHPAVARALLLLREHASNSLSDLAREAGIAAPYLSRLLIEQTGRSFIDWRNKVRLDRFMEKYQPGANLLNSALDAGFGSYARFHRVFEDLVGCSPSEWMRRTADQRQLPDREWPALDDFGVPAAGNLSLRQGWVDLVPAVAPALRVLLGEAFLGRLIEALPADIGTAAPHLDELDATLPTAERDRLIASLRAGDPARAERIAELMKKHDFPGIYARVLLPYGRSVSRLTDAVTALTIAVWVAANRGVEPGLHQVAAVDGQVRGALRNVLPRLGMRDAQAAHTALLCHFVIVYEAIEAARAAGDPQAFEQLGDAARQFAEQAFGGDITEVDLTVLGFAPLRKPPPRGAKNRKRAR